MQRDTCNKSEEEPLNPEQTVTLTLSGIRCRDEVWQRFAGKWAISTRQPRVSALNVFGVRVTHGFSESNHCGSSIAGGGIALIQVWFTPSMPGTITGTLAIRDDASRSPQQVSRNGTGEVGTPYCGAFDVSRRLGTGPLSRRYQLI